MSVSAVALVHPRRWTLRTRLVVLTVVLLALTAIRGHAELSRRSREPVPPDVGYALGRVESEAQRMTALVEDLLLLARLDSTPRDRTTRCPWTSRTPRWSCPATRRGCTRCWPTCSPTPGPTPRRGRR